MSKRSGEPSAHVLCGWKGGKGCWNGCGTMGTRGEGHQVWVPTTADAWERHRALNQVKAQPLFG